LLELTRKQAAALAKAILDLKLAAAEIKPYATLAGVTGFDDVWAEVPGDLGEDAQIVDEHDE